ncbi:hypothetical protein ACPWSR_09475 [Alloiococcus sp. CFN-8]|uniref:hypothetical protein n=1 Tax=Alloiococcus sp. CFN-8 TaxID=3416081 RepID=UPI003CF9CC28
MKNIFKKKLTTQEAAERLYDYTRAISTGIASDTDTLLSLGFENSSISLTELLFFQYIMYRTNLILWSKLQDELLYGEISKQYYALCTHYINNNNTYGTEGLNNTDILGKKIFSEFDKILKNNYEERIKVINSQLTILYYYNKGVSPTLEEKLNSLSLALKIEDSLLEEVDLIIDEL